MLIIHYFVTFFIGSIIAIAMIRSSFGVLILSCLFWPLIGLGLLPILILTDLMPINSMTEFKDYYNLNGLPGILTSIHILMLSIGLFMGYMLPKHNDIFKRITFKICNNMSIIKPQKLLIACICISALSYILYFYLVGVEVALVNAVAARNNDFEGFGESSQYMFLKTLAALGFMASSFLPAMISAGRWLLVLIYLLIILCAYLNSISRNLLVYSVFVPLLIYFIDCYRQKKLNLVKIFWLFVIVNCIIYVILYGKVFGHLMTSSLSDGYYEIETTSSILDTLRSILNNFGFMWPSVDAGIKSFLIRDHTIMPIQQLLALFFGFIPSRILEYIGLDILVHSNVQEQLVRANTGYFGYNDDTVPPLMYGVSSYYFPMGGGFIMGYFFSSILQALESCWIDASNSVDGVWNIWKPYFMFTVVFNFSTFIPSSIVGSVSQIIFITIIYYIIRKMNVDYSVYGLSDR